MGIVKNIHIIFNKEVDLQIDVDYVECVNAMEILTFKLKMFRHIGKGSLK